MYILKNVLSNQIYLYIEEILHDPQPDAFSEYLL